jgi:hypothetical protein
MEMRNKSRGMEREEGMGKGEGMNLLAVSTNPDFRMTVCG